MKVDAKLVYFFQKNKFCLLKMGKNLLLSALGIGRATVLGTSQKIPKESYRTADQRDP
jgi:hypothetical protein